MAKKTKEITTYSPMNKSCTNFEPFSDTTYNWNYSGLHCHDFFEFYLFFSDSAYYYLNEQVVPLERCTLLILPPFYLHGFIGNQIIEKYDRSWLYITPAALQAIGMGIQDFSAYFSKCVQTGKSYFYIDEKTAEECRTIIQKIDKNSAIQSKSNRWKNYLYVAEFLSKIYDVAQVSDTLATPITLNNDIQSVLVYINNHFTEDISIPELSHLFSISSSHLARTFSSYTGRSIYDYVLYRRIMLAKELIYSGKPFTEVSFECGFNDYSGFLRAFRKLTGQSPSTYRKYITVLID